MPCCAIAHCNILWQTATRFVIRMQMDTHSRNKRMDRVCELGQRAFDFPPLEIIPKLIGIPMKSQMNSLPSRTHTYRRLNYVNCLHRIHIKYRYVHRNTHTPTHTQSYYLIIFHLQISNSSVLLMFFVFVLKMVNELHKSDIVVRTIILPC